MRNGNCTNGFCRIGLLAAVALMVSLALACGETECDDGEMLVDGECLMMCDTDDDCDEGERCAATDGDSDVCVPDDTDNDPNDNDPNDNDPNDNDPNDNDPNDNDPNDNDPSGEDQELCEDFCDLIYGCLTDCGYPAGPVDGAISECIDEAWPFEPQGGGTQGCMDALNDPDDAELVETMVYGDMFDPEAELGTEPNTCDDVSWLHCSSFGEWDACGCDAPGTIGDSCETVAEGETAAECDAGDLGAGVCLPTEEDAEAGDPGVCSAFPCYVPQDAQAGDTNVDGACGAGNVCMLVETPDGEATVCDVGCDSNADCGGDQACQMTGGMEWDANPGELQGDPPPPPTDGARVCDFSCEGDDDCGEGVRCNDVGICELPCGAEGVDDDECEMIGGECEEDDGDEWCILE